ncbi:MAG: elongation factor P [Candidatus Buchananbacteria bacterium]
MSLGINDIKTGSIIKIQNEPFLVTFYQNARTAQRRAFARTKLKSLTTGRTLEKTFNASDAIEFADMNRRKANFLYKDAQGYQFMTVDDYEQFFLTDDVLGDSGKYLKEGATLDIVYFENKPASVELPKKVELKVVEAPPAIKGDSATGTSAMKEATLEGGIKVMVPLFIKEDEMIRVNTDTGEYVERVN